MLLTKVTYKLHRQRATRGYPRNRTTDPAVDVLLSKIQLALVSISMYPKTCI